MTTYDCGDFNQGLRGMSKEEKEKHSMSLVYRVLFKIGFGFYVIFYYYSFQMLIFIFPAYRLLKNDYFDIIGFWNAVEVVVTLISKNAQEITESVVN